MRNAAQTMEGFENGMWAVAGLAASGAAAAWRREGAYQDALANARAGCVRAANDAVADVNSAFTAGLRADVVALRAEADTLQRRAHNLTARLTGRVEVRHASTPTNENGEHALVLAKVRVRVEIGSLEDEIEELLEDLAA